MSGALQLEVWSLERWASVVRLLREMPWAQAPQRSTPARPCAMATAALRRRRTRCRQG